jgi:hypothetical protein
MHPTDRAKQEGRKESPFEATVAVAWRLNRLFTLTPIRSIFFGCNPAASSW